MTVSNDKWLNRVAEFLVRRRAILLIAGIVLTVPASILAGRLSFEQSIESLYSDDDPYLRDYLQSRGLFGGDEFLLVAYHDDDLLSPESLDKLRSFAARLSGVPGIQPESTQHLANTLRPEQVSFLLRLLLRTQEHKLLELSRGITLGDDDKTTAVVLRLVPESDAPIPRAETFKTIREMAAAHEPRAYVAGEPLQVYDMFRIVEADGSLLFRVSLVLLGLVLLALFRSLRWVLLALVVVVATILWTDAVLVVSRMELSMVSSMLNSLVTIIGIATVTHVTLHFREQRLHWDREEALRRTIVALAPAIFWTCTTTATGFAALLASEITPVRSFGIMMALATQLVMVTAATLLPGGILLGKFSADPGRAPGEERLQRMLGRLTEWVEHRPKLIGTVTVAIVSFAALGLGRLEVETDFSKNFRESSDIVQALDFIESRLGGAGTWEVNFPAPREFTPDFLAEVRDLAERLRTLDRSGESSLPDEESGASVALSDIQAAEPQATLAGESPADPQSGELTKVIAVTDVLDLVPNLPFTGNSVDDRLERIAEFQPEFVPSLYNPAGERMRLVLRARERQPSQAKLRLIDRVEQIADGSFHGAATTGVFVLLAHLIESLLRDQLVSFSLAAVGIGTLMSIAFRSLRIGLISLVPNLFPVVMLIGTMGWIGLPVNIGTAMIASVSIGLTVDSSIHYLSGFRRARSTGMEFSEAIRATHASVGRALVFATLALIVGFSVLTLSQFIPLVYFGMLVSVAMLGGLIGNLVLLPLLLRWADTGRNVANG